MIFFLEIFLLKDERNYLLKSGYKVSSNKSMINNKKEKYLLRPRSNEGIPHFFLVQDIKRFLEKNKIPIQIYQTVKPDLVFEIKGKKYAIEVESGSKIEKDKKMIIDKVKNLNENYDEWCFVVINRNYTKRYQKFGNATDPRALSKYIKGILKK